MTPLVPPFCSRSLANYLPECRFRQAAPLPDAFSRSIEHRAKSRRASQHQPLQIIVIEGHEQDGGGFSVSRDDNRAFDAALIEVGAQTCFHVSKRKVLNFLRVSRPKRASQMSECFGAGTGCGWCRTYLKKLFDAAQQGKAVAEVEAALPDSSQYAAGRTSYVKAGGGVPPPGATPIG